VVARTVQRWWGFSDASIAANSASFSSAAAVPIFMALSPYCRFAQMCGAMPLEALLQLDARGGPCRLTKQM